MWAWPISQAQHKYHSSLDCPPNAFLCYSDSCCNEVMFAGMSRDSGCSLIHPDPTEADTSDFISSAVSEILFRDLFTTSDCNFINSGGLGV